MPTPDAHDRHKKKDEHDLERSTRLGFEVSDANISGIAIFLTSLGTLIAVLLVVGFGVGKVINTAIVKHDGPLNRWNAALAGKPSTGLQNMTSAAVQQQEELHRLTERFPTPRLQLDDGDQDVTDLHAREDLLLDHYSWIDQKKGVIRIPIARAMELVAQRGLPVAPATPTQPLMTADKAPEVPVPLTNGFARTGYEQQALQTLKEQRMRGEIPAERAALGTGH